MPTVPQVRLPGTPALRSWYLPLVPGTGSTRYCTRYSEYTPYSGVLTWYSEYRTRYSEYSEYRWYRYQVRREPGTGTISTRYSTWYCTRYSEYLPGTKYSVLRSTPTYQVGLRTWYRYQRYSEYRTRYSEYSEYRWYRYQVRRITGTRYR